MNGWEVIDELQEGRRQATYMCHSNVAFYKDIFNVGGA